MAPAIASLADEPRFHTVAPFLNYFASGLPQHGALNALAEARALSNSRGLPLRFTQPVQLAYEQAIDEGSIPTREQNWHDFFNALAWFSFPRAKASLNRLHIDEISKQPNNKRGRARDVLTLFDESGMVIACADPALAELLHRFSWLDLFWVRRESVRRHMRFYIFGHALHEQLLAPYNGITGKAVILAVDPSFMQQRYESQLAAMDEAICAFFRTCDALASTQALQPVPVLGIPDWWSENENPDYYRNANYFRPGRRMHKNKAPHEAGL